MQIVGFFFFLLTYFVDFCMKITKSIMLIFLSKSQFPDYEKISGLFAAAGFRAFFESFCTETLRTI